MSHTFLSKSMFNLYEKSIYLTNSWFGNFYLLTTRFGWNLNGVIIWKFSYIDDFTVAKPSPVASRGRCVSSGLLTFNLHVVSPIYLPTYKSTYPPTTFLPTYLLFHPPTFSPTYQDPKACKLFLFALLKLVFKSCVLQRVVSFAISGHNPINTFLTEIMLR